MRKGLCMRRQKHSTIECVTRCVTPLVPSPLQSHRCRPHCRHLAPLAILPLPPSQRRRPRPRCTRSYVGNRQVGSVGMIRSWTPRQVSCTRFGAAPTLPKRAGSRGDSATSGRRLKSVFATPRRLMPRPKPSARVLAPGCAPKKNSVTIAHKEPAATTIMNTTGHQPLSRMQVEYHYVFSPGHVMGGICSLCGLLLQTMYDSENLRGDSS